MYPRARAYLCWQTLHSGEAVGTLLPEILQAFVQVAASICAGGGDAFLIVNRQLRRVLVEHPLQAYAKDLRFNVAQMRHHLRDGKPIGGGFPVRFRVTERANHSAEDIWCRLQLFQYQLGATGRCSSHASPPNSRTPSWLSASGQ